VVQVECEVQYALSVYVHALNRRSSSPDPRTLHAGVCCIYRRRCGPDGFQCLSEEAVAKSFSTAPEFTATTVFGTDMVTDIDTPASEGDIIRINIYRCLLNLSTAEFYKRMREFLQEFGALPVVQKHMLKYTRVCCPFLHYSPPHFRGAVGAEQWPGGEFAGDGNVRCEARRCYRGESSRKPAESSSQSVADHHIRLCRVWMM
jgi:hypothetical protein